MFEAILNQGIILKKIIEAIKELVTEVNFEVTAEGISLQAMDASHVALVVLKLQHEQFEEFRCDRPQTLGVSITNLSKLLKIAGNDDEITLKAEDEASVLTLVFRAKQEEKISEFNLNLLTLDSEHLGIPDQDYSSEVVMSSNEFSRICRELTQIADTLNVSIDKEALKLAVSGDVAAGSITMRPNDSDKAEEKLVLRATEKVAMAFALRYLNLFNKAAGLSEEVSISLSPNIPIVMKFAFDLGYVKYYLAPKIAEDAQQRIKQLMRVTIKMLKRILRNYVSIPGSKVRIIDDFQKHYDWMKANKPELTLIYFANSWNPECSRNLQKSFLSLVEKERFEAFVVNCDLGTNGERTQKYYCVKYQPTFLFLSDGLEVKRVVGSDLSEVAKQAQRVKKFRTVIQWDNSIQPGKEIYENYHDEHMLMWKDWDEKESWDGEGIIHLDRN